jgi:integrase
VHRLTNAQVRYTREPGLLCDGGGLYLQITLGPGGSIRRSWLFRYQSAGAARREMGLGSAELVTLAEARKAADAARRLLQSGADPSDARRGDKREQSREKAGPVTFRQAAAACIAYKSPAWGEKQSRLWASTLQRYTDPVLGDVPVADVTFEHVIAVLEPIWAAKPAQASRVRGRIETVLDFAGVHGWRSRGDNPARWHGNLDLVLPAPAEMSPEKHFPALPVTELPAFMARLRDVNGVAARALEITILTALRTGAVIDAEWAEIDFDNALWTVPAERMKGRRSNRKAFEVPLSRQAIAVLQRLRDADPSGALVFPGAKPGRALSNMAMLKTLERMGQRDITVHGFRSTFRDWAGDVSDFHADVAEAALAHAVRNKTERAYRRGDALEKRRRLMQAWAEYCDLAVVETRGLPGPR